MNDDDLINVNEMPTFLNELAVTFPDGDERRAKLVQCSIAIVVLSNSLDKANNQLKRTHKEIKELVATLKTIKI